MTEKLANLSWQSVALIVAALLAVRWGLLRTGNDTAKGVAEMAESLAVAMALVFFLIRPFLVQAFFIPSGSMHPTLLEDDHILVNKLGYRFWAPRTGDVVVFKAPPEASDDRSEKDFIKRLIATPGDTLEVKGGVLTVGGQRRLRADIASQLVPPDEIGQEIRCKYTKDGILLNGRMIPKADVAKVLRAEPAEIKIVPGRTILNGKVMDEPYTAEDPDYDMPKVTVKPDHLFMLGDNRNNSRDSHAWGQLERKRVIGKAMFIFYPIGRVRLVR